MPLNELPADDGTLYLIAFANGVETGIGTADEIRDLVADGILPDSIVMTAVAGTATR